MDSKSAIGYSLALPAPSFILLAHRSPLTAHHSPHTAHRAPPTVHRLPLATSLATHYVTGDSLLCYFTRLPEFKFWYSLTKAFVVAFFLTFFAVFNIPVRRHYMVVCA